MKKIILLLIFNMSIASGAARDSDMHSGDATVVEVYDSGSEGGGAGEEKGGDCEEAAVGTIPALRRTNSAPGSLGRSYFENKKKRVGPFREYDSLVRNKKDLEEFLEAVVLGNKEQLNRIEARSNDLQARLKSPHLTDSNRYKVVYAASWSLVPVLACCLGIYHFGDLF